ncbi:hypothetical protein EG348_03560 [Chryseobacterium sp. G0201]|nr:hypothetical protein EG348_03560 [Chryseobacterium sp. G0201]
MFAQVGIGTANPQATFHVDGAKDNSLTGVPSETQQSNDFVVKKDGSVGIGTDIPDRSSLLEIKSDNKGFLPPRVELTSATDRITIPKPATGLTVYHEGNDNLEAGLYTNIGTPSAPIWNKGKIINQNQGSAVYKTPLQLLSNKPVLTTEDFEFMVTGNNDIYIRFRRAGSREYSTFITENWVSTGYVSSAGSGTATNNFEKIAAASNVGSNNELNIIRIYDLVSKKVYRLEVNLIESAGKVYISQLVEVF